MTVTPGWQNYPQFSLATCLSGSPWLHPARWPYVDANHCFQPLQSASPLELALTASHVSLPIIPHRLFSIPECFGDTRGRMFHWTEFASKSLEPILNGIWGNKLWVYLGWAQTDLQRERTGSAAKSCCSSTEYTASAFYSSFSHILFWNNFGNNQRFFKSEIDLSIQENPPPHPHPIGPYIMVSDTGMC